MLVLENSSAAHASARVGFVKAKVIFSLLENLLAGDGLLSIQFESNHHFLSHSRWRQSNLADKLIAQVNIGWASNQILARTTSQRCFAK